MAVVRFQRRRATKRDGTPCRRLTMTRYGLRDRWVISREDEQPQRG